MLELEAMLSDDAAVGGNKSKSMKRELEGRCMLGSEHPRTIYV